MIEYSKDEKALIFLSQFDFITHKRFKDILEELNCPGDIFDLKNLKLKEIKNILKDNYELFIDTLKNFNQKTFFEILDKRGINCLTILSDKYPDNLKRLAQPPYVLYYVGNIELLKTKLIAMVGTRNPSTYGKIVTEKFSKEIASNGITIVSGLASGIDKISHEGALSVNGNTVAVLGGGFDHIFPAMNINLARDIAKKGLILTEYYLSTNPTKFTFPARNRIIAALSDAIIITEAGKKSGSLYTMEFGAEIGVDTYCVPGNITNELSYSTNELIKRGVVACITSANDILCLYGIKKSETKKIQDKATQLSIEESEICHFLKDGEKSFEYLQEKTGYSTQNLNISLTSLEINGIIKKLAGNTFILCP